MSRNYMSRLNSPGSRGRRTAIGGLLIAGFSLCLLAVVIWNQWLQIEANRTFVPVEGTILESRIKINTGGRTPSSHPHIRYRYEVEGRPYESTTITLSGIPFWGGDDMTGYVRKYPVGARVEVYYDPSNPSVAILDRTVYNLTYPVLVGTGFFVAGMAIAVYGFKSGRQAAPRTPEEHSTAGGAGGRS